MDEKIMEIVAPAGNTESLKAAVNAGANAVYLGLKGFGARRKAGNFTVDELSEAIDYAHLRGVRTYLTLNTILKDNEMKALYTNLKKLYNDGLDVIIVQDFGLFQFIKENFPEIDLHGSTQMTVSNHIEANYLKELGFKRVVLSRELSFEEIKEIREKTDIELEVFVSGSLCISYSGRCYFSSFLGGRSGNRGLCAQPCRRLYKKDQEEKYFLSPKDQIFSKQEIENLRKIGIESIKVEGRMKSPSYVYEMVKHFDNILKSEKEKREPQKIFNRGYGNGYFYGEDKNLINKEYSFDFGKKIGDLEGNKVKLLDHLETGDGISFVDKNKRVIKGTYVNKIVLNGKNVKSSEKNSFVGIGTIPNGTKEIFKTYDKAINDKIEKEIKNDIKTGIKGKLSLKLDKEIILKLENELINVEIVKEKAQLANNPMDAENIKEKISEIGDTNFYFKDIILDYDGKAFISFKELKNMKREAIKEFEEKIINYYKRDLNKELDEIELKTDKNKEELLIAVKIENEKQLKIVKEFGIKKIYFDSFEIIKENRLNEENIKKGDLIKNITQLVSDKEKLTLDFTMNVFNQRAYDYYEKFENIKTIYLSIESSLDEIKNIKSTRTKKAFVVYSKAKLMYIEHKILEEEKEELENEYEDKLILRKNIFGNTEVYLDDAFNIIDRIDDLYEAGVEEIRLDFTFESEDEIREILNDLIKKRSFYNPYNFEKGVL